MNTYHTVYEVWYGSDGKRIEVGTPPERESVWVRWFPFPSLSILYLRKLASRGKGQVH